MPLVRFASSPPAVNCLALLTHDHDSAAMVNLGPCEAGADPRDVYSEVATKVRELLKADDHRLARWWCAVLDSFEAKNRKLLKTPVMTYAYSVSRAGASRQIMDAYKGLSSGPPIKGGFQFLADRALAACELLLPGPATVMKYIRALAQHCIDDGRFLEWTSPTGFPVSNRYQHPNVITVNIKRGSLRIRHNIAEGVSDEINEGKSLDAASPNFVHSMDDNPR
jgi:DNA-directed RNA polymerase